MLRFPEGFVWGSGISAHQTEGGNRGNDWWEFEQAGNVANGEVSGDACDHYNRYAEDFALAASLGHRALKLSIEWSRIEPERGHYDQSELDHYARVLEAAREAGLVPFVTLHHFTNPAWLGRYGWWEGAQTSEIFGEYVYQVASRLEPWTDIWITINEPMLLAAAGYLHGQWPPQRRSWRKALRVAANLVKAHRLAYDLVHEVCDSCQAGPAVNVTALKQPGRPTLRDLAFGGPLDWLANYYFIDRARDKADFIGVQYYTRTTVQQLLAGDPLAIPHGMRKLPRTDLGWEIYPKGLYYTVRSMWRRFGLPVYVTENGIADAADEQRADFIREHLFWLHRAIDEGVDVRGYLHWALMDNFEWREGFGPRFGLVEIDYDTQERIARPSARAFERICRENGVEVPAEWSKGITRG
jgi:beta-glucosidase